MASLDSVTVSIAAEVRSKLSASNAIGGLPFLEFARFWAFQFASGWFICYLLLLEFVQAAV